MSTYVDLCRLLFVDLCLLFVDYMSTYVYLCRRICRLYVDICLLMSTYVHLCHHMSTYVDVFVDYMSTYVYLCRHMSTYVDICLLMSTIICRLISTVCRLYVDLCLLYVYLCRNMSTYVNICLIMSTYVYLCLLVSTYVDFTLYKSVQLFHISTTTATAAAMVMDYEATPTESAQMSSPTHTYQCRRLWKLDKLYNHGDIRCVVCREVLRPLIDSLCSRHQ